MTTMAKILSLATAASLLLTPALATAVTNDTRQCIQLDVPVHVLANNSKYNTVRVDNNIDAQDWLWYSQTWSHKNLTKPMGSLPTEGIFKISAQLCVPSGGAKSDILQIATHGVGFDKRYWDVEYKPEEYSYVDAVLKEGYSILSYDRLGNGDSDKPDAYDVVQIPVQVEILKELTTLARSGKITQYVKCSNTTTNYSTTNWNGTSISDYKPNKVVHVGHSYGSFTTAGFLSLYGNLSDGAILTGYLVNNQSGYVRPDSFGWVFARENDPVRFADRPSGYMVQGTQASANLIFLKKDAFEPEILPYAEKIKQSVTVGELMSGGALAGIPALNFHAPVQFHIGEFDFALCGGDCKNTYEMETLKYLYPNATDISVHLQPRTGHGLTLSTNATGGYEVISSYLETHGL